MLLECFVGREAVDAGEGGEAGNVEVDEDDLGAFGEWSGGEFPDEGGDEGVLHGGVAGEVDAAGGDFEVDEGVAVLVVIAEADEAGGDGRPGGDGGEFVVGVSGGEAQGSPGDLFPSGDGGDGAGEDEFDAAGGRELGGLDEGEVAVVGGEVSVEVGDFVGEALRVGAVERVDVVGGGVLAGGEWWGLGVWGAGGVSAESSSLELGGGAGGDDGAGDAEGQQCSP